MRPELSVVVVARNPPALLRRCLEALRPQLDETASEVLVVTRTDHRGGQLRQHFPSAAVRWLVAPPDLVVPRMRALGIAASRGRIVALLEDDCLVNAGWCAAAITAQRQSPGAVGGPIEPGAYRRGADWAVFYCEYGRFMRPFSGKVAALPGNNVCYPRALLNNPELNLKSGFYEAFFHPLWQRQGNALIAEPALAVRNVNCWSSAYLLWIPYHHGRAYAGQRFPTAPRRFGYALLAPLLPALKTFRVVREIITRRRPELPLLAALPGIALFMTSWSLGELIGYLFGAGKSAAQWR